MTRWYVLRGLTLWDHEKLKEYMTERPQPNSEFEIVASESISDKSSSLGVDAALKASFLSGLIKVNGSAKYLEDTQTSKQQARVTLKYKTTTRFRELTMNQLGRGNIKHPFVFEKGLATHVVTDILYGAQAFFVFDRELSDSENIQDIQGNLKILIKKIPCISIKGGGALKMEDKDRENINKFSCKFHGDFNLPQSPMTFEDAVKVYKDLPKLLGPDGENAVPVTVWLLPLTELDSSAAQLVRQISVGLVFEVEKTLEHLADLDMKCHDNLKSAALQQFPQISTKIRTFMSLCSQFNLGLQGVLAQKLPAIRGGGENEAELTEILKKRAASPFSYDCLNQWVTSKVREIHLIKTFTNMMKHTEVLSSQEELDTTNLNIKYAVCFVFTSLETVEEYLLALDQYLKGVSLDQSSYQPKDLEKQQWYSNKNVREAVRTKVKLFADFAEANKDNKDVKFMAVAFKDETHKGSTIYTYEDGFEASDDFVPPSKPEVKVDVVTHNSVTLRVSAPTWGAKAVTGYRLEYRENKVSSANGKWQQQSVANTGLTTVTELKPDTEYTFRLRALTEMGLGPMNELTDKTYPAQEGPRRLADEVRKTCKVPETSQEGPRRLADEVRKTCEVIETKGSLQILKVPLQEDEMNIPGCARLNFGSEVAGKKTCTIMMMGATGAGKSTLINGMINYILGVQWTDSYRFKLVVEEEKSQIHSQTPKVTVYKINFDKGFMIDYSLIIIDTPGFGDTRGIQRDHEITEQIRNLFSNSFGVDVIHTVCFVAQSALARLSATQRYVFDSILSIFGKNVAENVRAMVTFVDGQMPPVLGAITAAGVPCPKEDDGKPAHYKFNNSALFVENQQKGLDEIFWDMGKDSMKKFFDALDKTEPQSLTLTKEVLKERKQLEETVEDIEREISEGLAQEDEIWQIQEQIKKHEAEIERNKDFELHFKVQKPFSKSIIGSGNFITNCSKCHQTCHYPCNISKDSKKKGCWAMNPHGYCTKCPGKCIWSVHYNQKYRWEYKEVTETTTVQGLKVRFLKGKQEKQTTEDLILTLQKKYQQCEDHMSRLAQKATAAINRLGEIALRPNPLSTPDYIDMMIESEKNRSKSETNVGGQRRIQALEKQKRKAKILQKVGCGKRLLSQNLF
uniref:Fibronectin type-III domain-containing protein n=1 Tax=Knipowitschia caucasica TaxID=637954 RepID=A0AAV2KR97_KNICA